MTDMCTPQGGSGPFPFTAPITPGATAAVELPIIKLETLCDKLGLPQSRSERLANSTLKALSIINNLYTDNGKLLTDIDFTDAIWADRAKIERALHIQLRLAEFINKVGDSVNFELLPDIDLEKVEKWIAKYQSRSFIGKAFSEELEKVDTILRKIIKVPDAIEDTLKQVALLKELQELMAETVKNRRMWGKLLGETPTPAEKKNPDFWYRAMQLVLPLAEFCALCKNHPESKRLFKLLQDPTPVYDAMVADQH